MPGTVLILGQTGRFGRNASEAFAQAGWQVRGFDRSRDDLMQSAQGADVIVNAWNPAYPDWAKRVPVLHGKVRAAAKAVGSTVIIPGNVYLFGPDVPHPWSERSAHGATNPLGRIRIEMERAYARDGVKTIILRAGDFLDTRPSGNWFDKVMVTQLAKKRFVYPGYPDIPHAWAFLPDVVRAAVELAEMRDALPDFADVPFPGYTMSGREVVKQLSQIIGEDIILKRMNWVPLQILRPFWPMGRCLLEMRYLWNTPHSLDGRLFQELLPDFQATPPQDALRSAIAHVMPLADRHVDPNQSMPAGA